MEKFELDNLIRPNISRLQPYASARDEYVSDGSRMIFLDANENPFENGVNRYPDPLQRNLKSVLSGMKGLPVENILFGNGSDEVIDLLIRAFCEPGRDNVITLPPTYGMYKVMAEVNAVEVREVLLRNGFQPDLEAIRRKQDAASKIIFLCSPNNPSGNMFARETIAEILDSFPGLVVIDEAYIDFAEAESWTKQLAGYPNLVVLQTMSKAYGMAGIRLGICFASGGIIRTLNKIKPPYNVNELTQQRALKRLQKGPDVHQEVALILEQREKLLRGLTQTRCIEAVFPSRANFLLVKVDNAIERYRQLLQHGIVVRNRSTQPLCENTLRLTVGTADENDQLLNVLNSF